MSVSLFHKQLHNFKENKHDNAQWCTIFHNITGELSSSWDNCSSKSVTKISSCAVLFLKSPLQSHVLHSVGSKQTVSHGHWKCNCHLQIMLGKANCLPLQGTKNIASCVLNEPKWFLLNVLHLDPSHCITNCSYIFFQVWNTTVYIIYIIALHVSAPLGHLQRLVTTSCICLLWPY
jgi:hypothetical protein